MPFYNHTKEYSYKVLKSAAKDEELSNLISLIATKKDKAALNSLLKLVGPRIKGIV